ncbi:MAG: hypothetical protein JXB34_00780 [Bacteroidales bacterium]|nr:hypothetical protein [Bacteroidales bacterium]
MRENTNKPENTKQVAGEEKTRKLIAIDELVGLIESTRSTADLFTSACEIIKRAYPGPEQVSVRITCNSEPYFSKGFVESNWLERQTFNCSGKYSGIIEVFFSNAFIENVDKDIMLKDSEFLKKVATLIVGAVSHISYSKLIYDNTERIKELRGINSTAEILKKEGPLETALQQICNALPQAWQYPDNTVARIVFDNKVFKSEKFRETRWVQKQAFETPDKKHGSIEIFYLKEFPAEHEGPFLKEERNLIDNLAALISGTVSKKSLEKLLVDNTERLKELREINLVTTILKEHNNISDALKAICSVLPRAWQYSEHTAARITYGKQVFMTANLEETPWVQAQEFETPDNKVGLIEIIYLREFPEADEGPFLKEERQLLNNIASLISGSAAQSVFNKLLSENRERLKELKAINQTSEIIAEGLPVDDTLKMIASILPKSWQHVKHTTARIVFEGKSYESPNFAESIWKQKESFVTIDNKTGSIEIFYLKKFPEEYEGPFLREERNLLINIAKLIGGYLNNYKGRDFYTKSMIKDKTSLHKPEEYRKSLIENKQPLQLFFNKQALDKYIYLDMMKYKVKEILFVATLYDAFIMENEDNFFEQFMGEIYQFSLYSLPRITGVTSTEEAMRVLGTAHFDLAILMVGIDSKSPIGLSKKIKEKQPDLPVFLLVNHKSDIKHFESLVPSLPSIDKLFTWNGHSQIFFSIIKSIEDRANAENDTKVGLVRVILLIEDSAFYYSKYLQILYSIIFGQVQQILPEVEKNELDKISKMRSRPKVIHVRNYEEAVFAFNKYKDFLLCVISDVEFEHDGKLEKQAGINFIKYARSAVKNLPVILQSAELSNKKTAERIGAYFIDKNSENLHYELKKFLTTHLYFGDFVFRDKLGNKIAVAKSLREFETLLHDIPEESLLVHATENQFSLWLMSRGEIELARQANPVKISDFNTIEDFRHYFINSIKKYKEEKKKGRILTYDETSTLDEKNIVSLSPGSLGGKGRGLAFINALIYNLEFPELKDKIRIRTPITAVIGTDEFDNFIRQNQLQAVIKDKSLPYTKLQKIFVESEFSIFLKRKVQFFIEQVNKPIAVRSSSLSEDSITQPFAGVFDTFLVPNNDSNIEQTLEKVCNSIKLVYASIFSDSARTYFNSIHHKVEEEKMAIVLQELVGNQYGNYYYPHISGTAQSYNYYPVANMKPDEGFAVAAVGLGFYVVGGQKSYRFSPKYPRVEVYSTKDLMNSTQTAFLAVDLSKNNIDYLKEGEMASVAQLDIALAEEHGTLNHCASVYNPDNDRIEAGLNKYGPRVINFADILKFNYTPLAQTIDIMLNTIEEALGSPVEIEYAVDLTPDRNNLASFYLLQIKPLVGQQLSDDIDLSRIAPENTILYTRSSLGNGIVDNICDVIFIDNEKFDKLKTLDMIREIEHLNNIMIRQNKKYVLIGPGRWGTRDQFLGIPVVWSQISNARVIVEVSLENFPLDASLGSHFFHNITSMNIGYFSVLDTSETDYIRWEALNCQPVIDQTTYFKHVRFDKPLKILMNGKEKTSAITL